MLPLVTEALSGYINNIINVTIVYSKNNSENNSKNLISMWSLLKGDINKIIVYYEVIPVDNNLCGDYMQDKNFRKRSQEHIKQIWIEKDQLISQLII